MTYWLSQTVSKRAKTVVQSLWRCFKVVMSISLLLSTHTVAVACFVLMVILLRQSRGGDHWGVGRQAGSDAICRTFVKFLGILCVSCGPIPYLEAEVNQLYTMATVRMTTTTQTTKNIPSFEKSRTTFPTLSCVVNIVEITMGPSFGISCSNVLVVNVSMGFVGILLAADGANHDLFVLSKTMMTTSFLKIACFNMIIKWLICDYNN